MKLSLLVYLKTKFVYKRNNCSFLVQGHNQSTVRAAKRLASLFWYFIANSTIDTLHNTINGYEIACLRNSKYNVHACMIQTNADFMFENLIVFISCWLSIAKIWLNNYCRLQCSRIDICSSCFVYDLSNMIFCPIGSTLTKHPVASQIWTHNSKQLAYRLTA